MAYRQESVGTMLFGTNWTRESKKKKTPSDRSRTGDQRMTTLQLQSGVIPTTPQRVVASTEQSLGIRRKSKGCCPLSKFNDPCVGICKFMTLLRPIQKRRANKTQHQTYRDT
jgi:hypothetical protein